MATRFFVRVVANIVGRAGLGILPSCVPTGKAIDKTFFTIAMLSDTASWVKKHIK
jgi:hypothetical protein